MSAFAQLVTTTPAVTPAVVIPYIEYVVAVGQMLSDILVPLLTATIMALLAKFYPIARMLISEVLVERTLREWFNFGVNATAGAVKDGTVIITPRDRRRRLAACLALNLRRLFTF